MIVNKPPKSKIVKVLKEDNNIRLLQKQTLKSKWTYFAVEHTRDKISRQMERMNTIAEEIALRNRLVDSGSVESFLLNNGTYVNTAEKRRIINCKKVNVDY